MRCTSRRHPLVEGAPVLGLVAASGLLVALVGGIVALLVLIAREWIR